MARDPNDSLEIILAYLGLKKIMLEKNNEAPFRRNLFHIYTPLEYLQSARKETDERYRMGETVLVHKSTGLRIEYLTTENYFGDEYEYKLTRIFIIIRGNKSVTVTDVDFTKKFFITLEGNVPFNEAKIGTEGD